MTTDQRLAVGFAIYATASFMAMFGMGLLLNAIRKNNEKEQE